MPPAPSPRSGSDLGPRVLVAIPALIFAIFIVEQGGLVFTIGVTALALVCLHELYFMFRALSPARLAAFAGVIGMTMGAHFGEHFHVLLALAASLLLVFALSMVGPPRESATLSMAVTILGIYWVGLAFAHAVLLRDLPHGDGVLYDVLVGTFLGDTGAYFAGRAFGRRKLAPVISPNKTVEGLVGGMLIAIGGVWLAGLYQDWMGGWDALWLGVGVALTAPVGDLFESKVKRDAGTKDAGRLFGAHGGALDRLDAVMFSVVAGYFVWTALM